MNTCYEHHQDSIRFGYRCFDRLLLNGLIQPFQQPERVVGFFNHYRQLYPVSKPVLKDIAQQYEHWVTARAKDWGASIVAPPDHERRDDFVEQYFRRADPDQIVVILKAREPARILTAIGKADCWHLKAIDAVPQLRTAMASVTDRYLTVQQDILETFVDRGQLRQLAEPTRLATGKRIPGLTLDHPRQLAVMHALVRFAHIAAGDTFTMRDLHAAAAAALDTTTDTYRLSSLRYELSKLRAKGLVERVPLSRRYRLLPRGYSICLLILKLFERVYAPLTAGLLGPVTADARLADEKRHRLDRLYQRVVTDLDALLEAVGLRTAA